MSLSEEDSLLYHEVVADYGNYWETTINNQKKYVVFDFYSGKILVYINKDKKAISNNESPDYNFYWERDTLKEYVSSYEIYNTLGQKVKEGSFNAVLEQEELDLTPLQSGLYILNFKGDKTSKTVRIVKQ